MILVAPDGGESSSKTVLAGSVAQASSLSSRGDKTEASGL